MKTVSEHYDTHLGAVYAWMLGNLEAAASRAQAELADMGIEQGHGALAVDLGAGLGLHSAPLARQGFRVIAIDGCEALLGQLRRRCEGLAVTAQHADLGDFPRFLEAPAAVILCLGDTLTHLPSREAVTELCRSVAANLAAGGLFAASFRDYVSRELQGDERFILVRRDEERVLSCFLEYGPDVVTVNDMLTERRDREWVQSVSSYPKLRLAPAWVAEQLGAQGLKTRIETAPAGMLRVIATRET